MFKAHRHQQQNQNSVGLFDIEKKTNVDIIESQAGVKNDGFEQGNDDETVDLKAEPTHAMKVGSAIFYATASLAVIFANKTIMTAYQFPYVGFMATVQFLGTIVVLAVCHIMKKIELPPISWEIVRDIMPISVMFLGNILTGLGGTRNLNLPMFTCLRRFSILFTMLLEWSVLGSKPATSTQLSVALMLGGSVIAALYDFTYDYEGYVLVMANNLFTALNGVWMKKAVVSSSVKSNKIGVLFYNSMFSAIAMVCVYYGEEFIARRYNSGLSAAEIMMEAVSTHTSEEGDTLKVSTLKRIFSFEGWYKTEFVVMFICASLLGSVLNYSIFLCTAYNECPHHRCDRLSQKCTYSLSWHDSFR